MNAMLPIRLSGWLRAFRPVQVACRIRRCWCGATLCLPLLTGCATPALWSRTNYFPAIPPSIELSQCQNGILVQYRERSAVSARPQSRSFYLMQNTDRLAKSQRPIFLRRAAPGRPIPILEANSPLPQSFSTAAQPPGYCARLAGFASDFELYRDGVLVGRFSLPTYEAYANSLSARILLSPLTAALDVAGETCLAWLQAGAPGLGSACAGGAHSSGGLVAIHH